MEFMFGAFFGIAITGIAVFLADTARDHKGRHHSRGGDPKFWGGR